MPSLKILIGIIASILALVCYFPYIRDIFKRTTTPHLYTWLIWTLLQGTAVVAMAKSGAGIGIISLFIGAVFCALVFLLSFKYGTKQIRTFDTFCLIAALVAIGILVFLNNPLVSIILISLIDFIGFLPTYRKVWVAPHSETLITYFISGMASGLGLSIVEHYSFTTSTYLASLVVTNFVCVFIIMYRRKKLDR